MSEPPQQHQYIVVPVDDTNGTNSDGDPDQAAKIYKAIERSLHEKRHEGSSRGGPLKEIIGLANQDSLYRYISWESPVRTLGSFVVVLSVLAGAHYIPLTSWLLWSAATVLGVVSITEGANRAFGPNTILSRLRPAEYKRIPEPVLNATLHDIHDLLQAAFVQAQRMLYGEDLSSAFLAFIATTLVYQLLKIASPFGIAVTSLVAIYLAPLVASPRGRQVAKDVRYRAEELANTAVDQGIALAQDGRAKASELTTKAQEGAAQATSSLGNMASSLGDNARNLAQEGQRRVQGIAQQTAETTSSLSGAAAGNARKLPDANANVANSAYGAAGSVKDYASGLVSGASDKASQAAGGVQNIAHAAQSKASDAAGKVSDSSNNTVPYDSSNAYTASNDYHLASGAQDTRSQTDRIAPQQSYGVPVVPSRSAGDHVGSGTTVLPISGQAGGARNVGGAAPDVVIPHGIPGDRAMKRGADDTALDAHLHAPYGSRNI